MKKKEEKKNNTGGKKVVNDKRILVPAELNRPQRISEEVNPKTWIQISLKLVLTELVDIVVT